MAEINLLTYLTKSTQDVASNSQSAFMDKAMNNFNKIFDDINSKLSTSQNSPLKQSANDFAKKINDTTPKANDKAYSQDFTTPSENRNTVENQVNNTKDVHPSEKRDNVQDTTNLKQEVKDTTSQDKTQNREISDNKNEQKTTSENSNSQEQTSADTSENTEVKDTKSETKPENETSEKASKDETGEEKTSTDAKSEEKETSQTSELDTKEVKVDTDAKDNAILATKELEIEVPTNIKTDLTEEFIATVSTAQEPTEAATTTVSTTAESQKITAEQAKAEAQAQLQAQVQQAQTELRAQATENLISEVAIKAELPKLNIEVTAETAPKQADTTAQTTEKQAQTKVQPQTEQLKINLEASDIKDTSTKLSTAAATQATNKMATETPSIEINASAEAITAQAGDKKAVNAKEIFERANINQKVVDEMNVRVVSVQTTSEASSNLLSQQNASEQSIKLAFENANQLHTGNQTDSTKSTAFAKALDNAQQPKELNKSDILSQIHNKLETMRDEGSTKVTMTLRPENLGRVQLELVNGKDGLIARMVAENSQIKELLDKNLENLKNALGSQGVNVNNVTVKVVASEATAEETLNPDGQNQHEQENNQKKSSDEHEQQDFEQQFKNTFAQSGEQTKTDLKA